MEFFFDLANLKSGNPGIFLGFTLKFPMGKLFLISFFGFRVNDVQQFNFENQSFVRSDSATSSLTVGLIRRDKDFPISIRQAFAVKQLSIPGSPDSKEILRFTSFDRRIEFGSVDQGSSVMYFNYISSSRFCTFSLFDDLVLDA